MEQFKQIGDETIIRHCDVDHVAFLRDLSKDVHSLNLELSGENDSISEVFITLANYLWNHPKITSLKLHFHRECFNEDYKLYITAFKMLIYSLSSISKLEHVEITAADCMSSLDDCLELSSLFKNIIKFTTTSISIELPNNNLDERQIAAILSKSYHVHQVENIFKFPNNRVYHSLSPISQWYHNHFDYPGVINVMNGTLSSQIESYNFKF